MSMQEIRNLNSIIDYQVQAVQVSNASNEIKQAMLNLREALVYAMHEYISFRQAINDGRIVKPSTNDLTYLFAEFDRGIKMLNITKEEARTCQANLHFKNHLVAMSYYLISLITRLKIKISGSL